MVSLSSWDHGLITVPSALKNVNAFDPGLVPESELLLSLAFFDADLVPDSELLLLPAVVEPEDGIPDTELLVDFVPDWKDMFLVLF